MVIANEGNKSLENKTDSINLENSCSCAGSGSSSFSVAQNVGCVCGCSSDSTRASSEQSGRN